MGYLVLLAAVALRGALLVRKGDVGRLDFVLLSLQIVGYSMLALGFG